MASPELQASLFSLLTWHWITPLVKLGNQKILQKEDLYELIPEDTAAFCHELWRKASTGDRQATSVWKSLFRSLGRPYFLVALWKPVWLAAVLTQVYVLKALLHMVERRSKDIRSWRGWLLVLVMFLAVTLQSIAQNNLFSLCQRFSIRARSMINMAICDKLLSMRLVFASRYINEGKLLNLVSNDTQKLVDAGGNFHFAWFSFVEIFVICGFVIAEAGVSAVPGVILVLLCQPIPILMSWIVGRFRLRAIRYTDERMRLLGELIGGVKTVKLNGWTGTFLQLVSKIRKKEIYWIKTSLFLKFLILTLKDSVVPMASLLIFWTYARLHGHLTASMSFSVLALLAVLLRVFNFAPAGIQYAGEALVAVQRIQQFLSTPESNGCSEPNQVLCAEPEASVYVSKAVFSWALPDCSCRGAKLASSIEPILTYINVSIKQGQLVGITGAVGCGKSSLLLSLIGETNILQGVCLVKKPVAYVSQQPWIFNDTIRNNIVFGYEYDDLKYRKILTACDLDYDISCLPAHDDTEIGDRGMNLSGGQKLRISLARACYSSAPVVLLDDPFASVDTRTAFHLMRNVLHGILKERAVVLTTQDLDVLDYCDKAFMVHAGTLTTFMAKMPVPYLSKTCGFKNCKPCFRIDSLCQSGGKQRHATTLHSCKTTAYPSDQSDDDKVSPLDQFEIKSPDVKKDNSDDSLDLRSQDGPFLSLPYNAEELASCKDPKQHVKNSIGALTVKEDRVEGTVTLTTLKAYLRACSYFTFLFTVGAFLWTQAARVLMTYWLAIWADGIYNLKLKGYVGIYACMIAGATLFSAFRAYMFSLVTCVAANNLHDSMTKGILNAPLSVFDQNLSGRLLNRLGKDQACIDELLPNTAQSMLENVVGSLGSIAVVAVLVPWFLIAIPPFVVVLFYFQRCYTTISRELKRLDGISRSPISVHFIETLQGFTSIRAYCVEETTRTRLANYLDGNNSANILFQHVSRWLSFRLDLAAGVCVTLTALLVVLLHDHIAPGIAGVILVQSLQLTGLFQYGIRMAADTENHFVSVERVCAFADLPRESPLISPYGLISDDWPTLGRISFLDYTMAYREDLVPILKKVTLEIRPKEKIGILGRTGAGKSSLVHALFRLVDNSACSGSISIDGVDIKLVGVDDLRQRLSIVPQDPVLFKETIRTNMDPFERHTDNEIFDALKTVQLFRKIQSLNEGIYSIAGGDGASFSVGECQLLCLARAILRRSRILVLDEATSAINTDIDNAIQRALRKDFQSCTVLSIAHRASTVYYCDRWLLLSHGGHICELENPPSLPLS